ncbi:serine/threonine-protein kinase [Sorangium sp. So ce131]|uniref:serine/threonine-protein kinase n=1 Tax=Sorangium sp. So ce131 TaxID=3133282 RepID=UPI003F636F70
MIHDSAIPKLLAGRYRAERWISAGGMGTIWRALDLKLKRPVALKLMSDRYAYDARARARFAREARATAKLGSETDFVVQIMDFDLDAGTPFIVMELLRGEDLDARIRRCGPLSMQEMAVFLRQIALALREAHAIGLVHRDIKPSNLFISCEDEEERIKILDLGIVKEIGPGATSTSGELLGTLQYISPEQLDGDALDHRADLWSLGLVAYQALSGRLPFQTVGEQMTLLSGGRVPRISQIAPGLPVELDGFFERAFQIDPALRFQTAEALARAFLATAKVAWRPPVRGRGRAASPRPRSGKPTRPSRARPEPR